MISDPAIAQDPTPSRTAASSPLLTPTGIALAQAKKDNRRIEIKSLRSENATYYANPDGKTLRMEQHLQPIRVKNAKGDGFTPIDTTLVEVDGVIKPKAVKGELTLSAGDDAFVLKSKGSKGSATIGSPGKLPKPTIDGSTATYPSLYGNGIDLVVTATATGFKQEIVLRERVTGPVSFRIPTTVPKNLALEEDSAGKPALLSQGKKIADLPAALLLDAVATDLNSDADAGKVGKAAVTLDQSASALVYTPDPDYLADPAVAYPVTLAAFDDDWWEPELGNDTFVNNADYPNGYANSSLDRILVGKSNDGAVRWRSYIRFDEFPADHPIRGATIQNADLVLWNHLSSDCGEFVGSGITAYQVTERWDVSTLTWSSQPRITTTGADTEYAGYAGEFCTGAMNYPWDLIHSVDDIVQAWADGEPNYGFQLTAGNESDLRNWRRYRTNEAGGCTTTPRQDCLGTLHPPILTVDFEPPPPPVVDGFTFMSPDPITSLPTWEEARARSIYEPTGSEQTSISNEFAGRIAGQRDGEAFEVRADELDLPTEGSDGDDGSGEDTRAPQVIAVEPADGEVDVPLDAKLKVTFSEPVDEAAVVLKDAGGADVTATMAYDTTNTTVTVTPAQALEPETTYTAAVSGAIDSAENTMDPYSWSFTTGGPDTTAPTVTAANPTPGATDVPVTTPVTATFSEAVTDVQFTLKDPGGASVAGTTAMDASQQVLTFTPAQPLADTTAYTGEVSEAKDAAGNAMAGPYTWSFTTGTKPPSGLVAAYGMDEGAGTSVSDSSGHNNTGTATATSWQNGKYGKALSFNGTSSWVTVEHATSLRLTTGMTLSAWVNPTTVANWRSVVGKELQTGGASYLLYASDGTAPTIWAQTDPDSETIANGRSALPVNAWSHLAATYDGTRLRLFVNGQQANETEVSGDLFDDGSPLRIGGNAIWGEYFSGLIDEVRIYQRAQTAAEIQADMNTPVGSGTPNPDTTPPAVSTVTPAAQASDVPVTTPVTATFSEAVTDAQFTLKDPVGASVAGTTAMDASQQVLTFTPAQPLADTTAYTAEVSEAKDAAGNAMAGPYTWSFTTGTKPPTGLVAAYGMNEATGTTVGDSSGHHNTGVARDTTWATGKHGTALSFNGTSSWVTVEHAASLRLTNKLTLSAWVRPSALDDLWRTVLMKEHAEGGVYGLYASTEYTAPAGWLRTTAEGGGLTADDPLPLNQWSHLATTYDGATFSFYVNGTLVSQVPLTGDVLDDGGELRIGGNAFWDEFYRGLIDEVRVYNRVQSAARSRPT
ncbi:LamG-like jellyroll fold domain-containing protein [Nonomuraea harbinensis]|uniref:LamG-like jellyroll fold domain-containing protein n=1 Tax=Nonomuraea harbinensis TaxID=1286938 RepID=A0ABW1BPM3_9ACTN|nr:LamG-like jellyroll fold domain-containing protein [Nonomuraea harbinensis]